MKKLLLLSLTIALTVSCGTSSNPKTSTPQHQQVEAIDAKPYAETITAKELKTMLYTYASDEFEGRDTGKKGQKLAVEYLKEQYKEMDIPTPLGGDDYFQEVPLEKQRFAEAQLSVNGKVFKTFKDYIVLSAYNDATIKASDIVFVGHGIDDSAYSDYKAIDVSNKIVLAKSGEPKTSEGNYLVSGTIKESKWSNAHEAFGLKKEAAQKHGAKLFLYLDDVLFSKYATFYQQQAESGASGRLSLKSNDDGLLMLLINENLGKALYPSISEEAKPKRIETDLLAEVTDKSEFIDSENVVAYIKGSEKPEEIIVLSAHLDHEGIKNGEIYNGADDDGSGTVAILEIAEAFKTAEKAGHGPKRSILFLHVTGEEKGLLGSRHYTDNDPIFPLENTVANLNIDMIGRTDPKRTAGTRNYIYLIGSDKLSTELHDISEATNTKYVNLELDYTFNDDNDPNRFYYRSDHYNFAKNNIPVIFYFNGTHEDYHKPTDTADKIEYDLLETRTRLIFYTAWELANRDKRIIVDKIRE